MTLLPLPSPPPPIADDSIPDDPTALADEIARTAANLDAATHRLLACIRRFDESGEWGHQGAISCAHWLSWRVGYDLGTAREKVRVARALGTLPAIDEALGEGKLSYAKVRAMTRVATPENEARLLDMANYATGGQLERICRRFRKVVNLDEDGERLDERRYVREEALESGMVRLSAVLHPDEAALVMKAIEAARRESVATPPEPTTHPEVSAETRADQPKPKPKMLPTPDALVKVAESFLADGQRAGSSGDRNQIVVHLDQDVLTEDGTLAACLDDGTRLSAETFRRLACDAGVVPMVHGPGGQTVDVGRRTRTIPPALRRLLWARDRGCRFPGCTHRLYAHAHHIEHWAHGGDTSAENLILLCSTHHRLLHEGGFTLDVQGTQAIFRDPRGRVVDDRPPPAPSTWASDLVNAWLIEHPTIDAETNYPAWDGSWADYDASVTALLPPLGTAT